MRPDKNWAGHSELEMTAEELEQRAWEDLRQFTNNATMEQIERVIYEVVIAAPNIFLVARALRDAFQEDWERNDLATLLTEGVEE